jgi:dTDP-4-dehydrorhamnose 3,5-epimerase
LERRETALPGVWELRSRIFHDARGFFLETYDRRKFAEMGIRDSFVQDDYSCSSKGTLRGLHYQIRHPQAKLCRVVGGEAFDVAVDIRVGPPYFGKWAGVLLRAEDQNQVYIPAGFAHGFLALRDNVQFVYKCSEFYDPPTRAAYFGAIRISAFPGASCIRSCRRMTQNWASFRTSRWTRSRDTKKHRESRGLGLSL